MAKMKKRLVLIMVRITRQDLEDLTKLEQDDVSSDYIVALNILVAKNSPSLIL